MFKFIDKHPFISGFIAGLIVTNVIRKNIKKLVDSRVTIIQLEFSDPENKNIVDKETPTTKTEN